MVVFKISVPFLIWICLACPLGVFAQPYSTRISDLTIGGVSEFGKPIDLCVIDDQIFVADSKLHQIVVLNMLGERVDSIGLIGSEDGFLFEPMSIAADNTGRLYIADSGNERIQVFTKFGQFECSMSVGGFYKNISARNNGEFVVSSGFFSRGTIGLRFIGCEGDATNLFGGIPIEDKDDNVYISVNQAIVEVAPSGGFVVAFQKVPHLEILDNQGKLIRSIEVHGKEIEEGRNWFFETMDEKEIAEARLKVKAVSLNDFIVDLRFACVNNRPTGVYYIMDLDVYGDYIFLLINGIVYKYDYQGKLIDRIRLKGKNDRKIYLHKIIFGDDGSLFAVDVYHHKEIYVFKDFVTGG